MNVVQKLSRRLFERFFDSNLIVQIDLNAHAHKCETCMWAFTNYDLRASGVLYCALCSYINHYPFALMAEALNPLTAHTYTIINTSIMRWGYALSAERKKSCTICFICQHDHLIPKSRLSKPHCYIILSLDQICNTYMKSISNKG